MLPPRSRAPFVAACVWIACGSTPRELGRPCVRPDDCPSTLMCDVHEGGGSCQFRHDHERSVDTDGLNAEALDTPPEEPAPPSPLAWHG